MPPPARDLSKAQPMSISQLCQQDYESHLHTNSHELDHDHLDLNSGDDSDAHYLNRNGNGYPQHNGRSVYSQNSDVDDDDYDEYSNRGREPMDERADSAEQLAAEVLGDMANANRASAAVAVASNESAFAAPANPFMSRMSSLPLVNSALKAYESGKQNSKVMKVCPPPVPIILCQYRAVSFTHSFANVFFPFPSQSVWRRDGRVQCQVAVEAGL